MENDGLVIYFCGEEENEPGQAAGPAIKPHYILHIVLSGKGIFQKGSEIYHLKEGDVFLACPEEMVYLEADEYEPWNYAWTAFFGKKVRKMLLTTHLAKTPVYTIEEGWEEYKGHVLGLLEKFRGEKPCQLSMIGELLCLFGPMVREKRHNTAVTKEQYVGLAKEYMRNNYSYDVRIHEVADYIGIDRSYLYRLFMELEGMSPRQYLVQYRLEMARAMLEIGKYRIRDITFSCGFSDILSFETYFKEQEGISPEEYMWKYKRG